jgi:hypothetical protein
MDGWMDGWMERRMMDDGLPTRVIENYLKCSIAYIAAIQASPLGAYIFMCN